MCRYQNQNFSLVSHLCCTRVVCVALLSHLCCTRVSLMLDSCCQCCIRVALVSLVSGTRVVNQIRLNIFIFLNINTNQTSKEHDLNFIRSSHLFQEQPQRSLLEAYVGSKLSGLQLYFTGVFENFCHFFLTSSKKFIKILKVGKIFRWVTFYQHFFVK